MRYGFTTGSCASAAAKAAAEALLLKRLPDTVTIRTPSGLDYEADILDLKLTEGMASCAVKKDSGDDPDITRGLLIYAKVAYLEDSNTENSPLRIEIEGGEGVGKVTRPGLDRPVGDWAINTVPRRMIREAVEEICQKAGYKKSLKVIIYVPEGRKAAQKTFNPKLGIEGGISIIGTSGLVIPMSSKAILDTIKLELQQRRALGYDYVVAAPGNYGADYMKATYSYDIENSIKTSNYIGKTIDMALEAGFSKMLLTGHIGKLIKLAGGILYTHSEAGDCRMELLAASALKEGAGEKTVLDILDCVNTEAALDILIKTPVFYSVMDRIMGKIMETLNRRAQGKMKMDCIMFSSRHGELAKSKGAKEWFTLLEQDAEQKI